MTTRYAITLLCALAVFAVGSGIRGVEAAGTHDATGSAVAVYAAPAESVRAAPAIPVLPTVVVTASTRPVAFPSDEGPSVMFDAAVGQAGAALANGASRSVRRIGLRMPYYAFGTSARGTE